MYFRFCGCLRLPANVLPLEVALALIRHCAVQVLRIVRVVARSLAPKQYEYFYVVLNDAKAFTSYFILFQSCLCSLFILGIFVGIRPPPRSWAMWNFGHLDPVEIIKRKTLLMTSERRKTKSTHFL